MNTNKINHSAPALPRGRYPLLAAAILLACGSAGVQANESLPTGEVHGHQITTSGLPILEYAEGAVRVKTLPIATDEDSTDTLADWRYLWQINSSDVEPEAAAGSPATIPSYVIRQEDFNSASAKLCLKAVSLSGYPEPTRTSQQVCSENFFLANTAPSANELKIAGELIIGQAVAGNYIFVDADGDVEEGTTFNWYRSDDALGTLNKEAVGAGDINYVVQAADLNKYLSFEVKPKAATGIVLGEAVSVSSPQKAIRPMLDNFSGPGVAFHTFSDAVVYCDALIQHGYSDWRLPTTSELVALYNKYPNDSTATNHYWGKSHGYRSSTLNISTNEHELVYFNNGNVVAIYPDTSLAPVTCVR